MPDTSAPDSSSGLCWRGTTDDNNTSSTCQTNSDGTPLSYSLGAGDISKIVDALLPVLSHFFPKLTKDELYVALHRTILFRTKDQTFSNKDELDRIVKGIVDGIVTEVIQYILTKHTNGAIPDSCGAARTQNDNSFCWVAFSCSCPCC